MAFIGASGASLERGELSDEGGHPECNLKSHRGGINCTKADFNVLDENSRTLNDGSEVGPPAAVAVAASAMITLSSSTKSAAAAGDEVGGRQ